MEELRGSSLSFSSSTSIHTRHIFYVDLSSVITATPIKMEEKPSDAFF